MKHIISINEFDSNAFGDSYGYGGANGVFKINYKPFSDLSVSVGPDPNVDRTVKGSHFQLGDVITAQPLNSKKRVIGVIVRAFRNPDNQQYRYFIQVYTDGKKTESVIEVKSDTVKFAEGGDHGNMETISKYKNNEIPGSVYNSDSVYSSNELGLETTGG